MSLSPSKSVFFLFKKKNLLNKFYYFNSIMSRLSTTSWAALLGAKYPVVQAPMAGVSHTHHLAAAIISAGGIGSIGAANLKDPEQLREAIRAVRKSLTHNQNASNVACLNVNLQMYGEFAVTPTTEAEKDPSYIVTTFRKHSQDWLNSARSYEMDNVLNKMIKDQKDNTIINFNEFAARYGREAYEARFFKMLEVVLQERPAMFTTIFGFIDPQLLKVLHRHGIAVGATTTCFMTEDDRSALEKAETELSIIREEEMEEELVEFTPDLLEKSENNKKKESTEEKRKKLRSIFPPTTEAITHFESGIDFLFLQTTHAGGHQGIVTAPLPIPHQVTKDGGDHGFHFSDRFILDKTDPSQFYNPKQSPLDALVEMRRSYSRQLAINYKDSIERRKKIRAACPFPDEHPFSPKFDEKRSKFLDSNCFLIGCGGISTGRDVVEVMSTAQVHGAAIGSRFLMTKESQYSPLYKYALRKRSEQDPKDRQPAVFSRAFGGRWARVIETDYIKQLNERKHGERVLPWPLQQGVTGKRRAIFSQIYSENKGDEKKLDEASQFLNLYIGSKADDWTQKEDGRSAVEVMTEIGEEFGKEYIRSQIEGKTSNVKISSKL